MLDRISEQEGVGVFACNAVKRKVGQEITTVTTCYDLRGEHFSVSKMPTKQFTYPMFVCFGFVYSGQLDK